MCDTDRSQRRACSRGKNLLRLHHEQPAPGALHWNYKSYRAACAPAQIACFWRIHNEIQRSQSCVFRAIRFGVKAIRREKELKDWRREKKIALIEASNPKWRDLSYGWYQPARLPPLRRIS